jgi:hypothetical protein
MIVSLPRATGSLVLGYQTQEFAVCVIYSLYGKRHHFALRPLNAVAICQERVR